MRATTVSCVVSLALLLAVAAESQGFPAAQDEAGYINGWLLAGPIPWDGNQQERAYPLAAPPALGRSVPSGSQWMLAEADGPRGIDLMQRYGENPQSVMLAACMIEVDQPQPAQFRLGSDDGIVVWLNGERVHAFYGGRGVSPDNDIIDVNLRSGANTVVLEVIQQAGGWGCCFRVTQPNGDPLSVEPWLPVPEEEKAFVDAVWQPDEGAAVLRIAAAEALAPGYAHLASGDLQLVQRVPAMAARTTQTITMHVPLSELATAPAHFTATYYVEEVSMAATEFDATPGTNVSRAWLEARQLAEEPGLLVRTAGNRDDVADAFLGNGYYGIRLNAGGAVPKVSSGYLHPSATEVAGLYREGARLVHPMWTDIAVHTEDGPYTAPASPDYQQTLDTHSAVLTTEDIVASPEGVPVHFTQKVMAHRTRPHLLAMTYAFSADSDTQLRLTDVLDAGIVEVKEEPEAIAGNPALVSYRVPGIDLTEAVAVRWDVPPEADVQSTRESDNRILQEIVIELPAGVPVRLERYAALHTTYDASDPADACRRTLEAAAAAGFDALRAEHDAAWAQLWAHQVHVDNERLQRLIDASFYQLYAHLRSDYPWSLGPTGLSSKAWEGRVFWDADMWVFPPVLLFNPAVARSIVEYRYNTLAGARADAEAEGRGGAKFAWESARTGTERCPWPPAIEQRHIQNDVALAQWQYALVSGDEDYLREKALPVITASADYWVDRVVYNQDADRYEIREVLGPDEFAENIDNNATTNYGAAFTLRLAGALHKRFGRPVRPEWQTIADKLYLPFDETSRRYRQHDAYSGDTIKQADTSLLIYPWNMPMDPSIARNILEYYPARRSPAPIMMSSAIYATAFAEIEDQKQMERYFDELLQYFWRPYLLASESPNRGGRAADNCIAFATGIGGFLQAIVNGFAGVRIMHDGLRIEPHLPAFIDEMVLEGIHFAGQPLRVVVRRGKVSIEAETVPTFRIYDAANKDYPIRIAAP